MGKYTINTGEGPKNYQDYVNTRINRFQNNPNQPFLGSFIPEDRWNKGQRSSGSIYPSISARDLYAQGGDYKWQGWKPPVPPSIWR